MSRRGVLTCAGSLMGTLVLSACGASAPSTADKPDRGFTGPSATSSPTPTVASGQVAAACTLGGTSTITWNNPFSGRTTPRIQLTFYYRPPYNGHGVSNGFHDVGTSGSITKATSGNIGSGWTFQAQFYDLDTGQQFNRSVPCG